MYDIVAPSGRVLRPPKGRCWSLIEPEFLKLREQGRIWFGKKGDSSPGIIRYLTEVEGLVPWTWWPHEEVGHTDEAKKEVMAFAEGGETFDTPKPERLIKRILDITTNPGELVLDCFAGSGTTAAVAHKMGRQWIAVESEPYCRTFLARRLRRVVSGSDPGGVTEPANWKGGGGYRFCALGETIFDDTGRIRETVSFLDLAHHVFFTETGQPMTAAWGKRSPLIGVFRGTAYYLLFNGILGDKRPDGGNVLTSKTLVALPSHHGPRVIYGEGCLLRRERLKREQVTFRQIPYGVRVG
jgi:adenine-specific DNA-methyltransferase